MENTTMITTYATFNEKVTLNDIETTELLYSYLNSFVPKIVCFESYWSDSLMDTFTVKPFLKAIPYIISTPIEIAHRFIDSTESLKHYMNINDGLFWQDETLVATDIFFMAIHGKRAGLKSTVSDIEAEDLFTAFEGLHAYDNIVYFSSCDVLKGKQGKWFANELLRRTGTKAVVGYTTVISHLDAIIIDTLFLSHFFGTSNRYAKLQEIYDSVLEEYPLSKKYGFSIFLREDS